MRKLALAGFTTLLLAACGSDTKSCSTAPAQLQTLATGCTLAPGTRVALRATALCDTCTHTSPSCVGEPVSGAIELNPIFQDCAEDRSCNGGCTFGPLDCTFTTPSATGPLQITYPSQAPGGLTTVTVNVAADGTTSCSALTAVP